MESPPSTRRLVYLSLVLYAGTSAIAVLGVYFGFEFVEHCREHPHAPAAPALIDSFAAWDGQWYTSIVENGYRYDPSRQSNTAFAPLYPVAGYVLKGALALPATLSLVIVSHLALAASFVILLLYVTERRQSFGDARLAVLAGLAMGLFPGGLFFRMAYAESLFMLCLLVTMYGLNRQWPVIMISLLVGLATLSRLVGIALILPLAMYVYIGSRRDAVWAQVMKCSGACALALWGLVAMCMYSQLRFNEPFAFTKSHQLWKDRDRPESLMVWSATLATLQPITDVYDKDCICYWGNDPPRHVFIFNMSFWHPILFMSIAGAVAWGMWSRTLSAYESILAVTLLAIPYVMRSYELCMAGAGRQASVVFPAYIALACMLRTASPACKGVLAGIATVLLFVLSALYATWYWVF